ncbi:hypothetical protein [Alcanivorax sp. DP30]|uniref:hypothetical protein n=1 Tax=Alcanivorax sp. DP30 TaxID=2606217 RepID=UPI00136C9D86|nr:hypothetical protein [Alcanivorax sp. DP30]MZR61310.1 hypothetical protein [Alcanivorax sp. DP30]
MARFIKVRPSFVTTIAWWYEAQATGLQIWQLSGQGAPHLSRLVTTDTNNATLLDFRVRQAGVTGLADHNRLLCKQHETLRHASQ